MQGFRGQKSSCDVKDDVVLYLVLTEQKWKQHKQTTIMDNPPDINGTFG